MDPTLDDVDNEYSFYFRLADLNFNDPKSAEYTFKVLVL